MFRFPDRFAKFIVIRPAPRATAHLCVGPCWDWCGADSGKEIPGEISDGGRGYGKVWFKGRSRYAHIVIFEIFTGQALRGYVLDHLCRRRSCVSPLHVEPTTVQINTLRGDAILYKVQSHLARKHGEPPFPGPFHPSDAPDPEQPRSTILEDVPF